MAHRPLRVCRARTAGVVVFDAVAVSIDLGGRRALVTGAGQGVGRGIALTLARAGADVVVNDLVHERAASVVSEIGRAEGTAAALAFDVTDWAAVQAAVEGVGPLDIVVNNAGNAGQAVGHGFEEMKPFAEEEPSSWEPFVRVNLFGVMYVTRAASALDDPTGLRADHHDRLRRFPHR